MEYVDEKGEKKRPVIVHRAILGSVERMIADLTESFAGKWPFWLSPRQCMVVPVAPPFNEYAEKVQKMLKAEGYMIDVNVDNSDTMNKKVRNAQIAQYNFIFGESYTVWKFCYFVIKQILREINFLNFIQSLEKKKKRMKLSTSVPGTTKSMGKGPWSKLRKCSKYCLTNAS